MSMSFENTTNDQLLAMIRVKKEDFSNETDRNRRNELNNEIGSIMSELISRQIQDGI